MLHSPKERVLAAMRFDRPDGVPVWTPAFDDAFVPRWREHMGFGEGAHPLEHYRNDTEELVGDERFFPSRAGYIHRDGDYDLVNDGWGCIVRSQPGTYFTQVVDRVLQEPGDLDHIDFETTSMPQRFEMLDEQMLRVRRLGQCGFVKMGGVYIRSQFLRGEENLLLDMATDEAFCDALFDKVSAHLQAMALRTLEHTGAYDTGLIVNDDMAGVTGPLFSPRMFERFLMPRYRRIIAACHAAGCQHFIFHSDGQIAPLIDLILECGFEGINPIEPRCNPGLLELRQKYGRRLILMGGVCNTQVLLRNDPHEIERHLRPLIELSREGGVVLGTASIPAETPPAAYDLMMRYIQDGTPPT